MGASLPGGGRARSGRRGRRSRPMSEINVTPMVAAPLLTVGVPIELPKTAAAPLPTEQEEPLTIALTADGEILVQNAAVSRAELVPLLRAVSEERQSDKIFLRADGALPYEGVMQVMGALNAGGFRNIGLVTEQGGPRFDGEDG